jgi:hypothetical protein
MYGFSVERGRRNYWTAPYLLNIILLTDKARAKGVGRQKVSCYERQKT